MSHFCQYYPVHKTGGQNMYHILEGNDLQFYIFVRLCLVIRGSLAHSVYFCLRRLKAGAHLMRKSQISFNGAMFTMICYPKKNILN